MTTLSQEHTSPLASCWTEEKENEGEEMKQGKMVILVISAPNDSKSSQRRSMLDARDEKLWEQGPGRTLVIPGYHAGFL